MDAVTTASKLSAAPLSTAGRYLILAVAFLGWLCAGFHMSITQLAGQPAAIDLLDRTGALDAARLQALNRQRQTQGQTPAPQPRPSR